MTGDKILGHTASLARRRFESAVGPLTITASQRGIVRVHFGTGPANRTPNRWISQIKRELSEYFRGKRTRFDVPLDLKGSDFQLSVWKGVAKTGFGQTAFYQEIARRSGRPKATRAAGTAIGMNPVPIIIPCHRVIRKTGSMGGFSAPLAIKKRLLDLEVISTEPVTRLAY